VPRPAAIVVLGIMLALAASGCGGKTTSGAATTSAAAATPATTTAAAPAQPAGTVKTGNAACQSIPHPGGLKAVFGRRSSAGAAEALRSQAESRGFKGLDVEENGCGNFSVTLPGLADSKQFAAFKAEAKSAGFVVTLRCEALPDNDGDFEAVFGVRSTHHGAVNLKRLVVHRGFVGADIEEDACDRWSVVVNGITTAGMQKSFAAEASSAGFHVTFEPS